MALKLTASIGMSESIICNRSFQFAVRVFKLCHKLSQRGQGARHIGNQLLRCSTSIGSNAEEAQEGQTKADFIAKLAVSRKEAREAAWWLRFAVETGIVTRQEIEWETAEVTQLLLMIRAAIRTAQSSPRRSPSVRPPA
jgi:four helix bundle protein